MEKIKKIFNINMTYLKVIIFAIITGLYTGLVMVMPFLKSTSFQDIGVTYEAWILFALIITVNSKKSWEAALKCFIFFLISQPLVYLVESLFGLITISKGIYYYKTIWLPITLLTLPGGFIAYFSKKDNILGSIILGLGNTMLSILGIFYLITCINNFPYHLLTVLFCFNLIFLLTFSIQSKRVNRLISLLIPLVLSVLIIVIIKLLGLYLVSNVF